jgi:hypothetical protein
LSTSEDAGSHQSILIHIPLAIDIADEELEIMVYGWVVFYSHTRDKIMVIFNPHSPPKKYID